MNAPAPLLRSLELKSMTKCRLRFEEGAILFQGTGPQLRHLGLDSVAIPWDSYLLRNLQHLSISQLEELSPSCAEVLEILRVCPGLVELDLSLEPVPSTESRKKETSFTLTELRSLSLSFSTHSTFKLLEPIHLPSIQSVSLNLECNSIPDNHFPRIMKRLQTLFPVVFNTQHTLLITLFGANELTWACKPHGEARDWREFEITVRGQSAAETLECLIDTLMDSFPAEFIEIYLDSPSDLSLWRMMPVFDVLDHVRTILASHCDLDPLFAYVSASTTCDDWAFPELQGITIYDCDYNPSNLLGMVEARHGLEEVGSDISDDEQELPPPLKWITISHAPGEADEDILGRVKDILGPDCFEFDEKVKR